MLIRDQVGSRERVIEQQRNNLVTTAIDGQESGVEPGIALLNRLKLSREILLSTTGGNRVLLLVLADAEAACLQFLGAVSASLARMPVIVIGNSSTMELEWAIRDLGASHFVNELTPLQDVARICRRFGDSHNR